MKYLSSQDIYKIDKLATEKFLIPSFILMENAGRSVAEFVLKHKVLSKLKNILIFCGPGKNGGDGFVAARYLFIKEYNVNVIKFVPEDKYQGDSLLNLRIIKNLGIKIFDYPNFNFVHCDLVIDAIFGIGLNRSIEGVYKEVIEKINSSGKPVISIDIPSGLDADTGKILGSCIKAKYTITMGFYKIGFKNKIAKKFCGRIIVADIGYPKIKV